MSNKMLIDASHPEETRVAVVRGNRIEEYDFESQEKEQLRGNIYLAKVTRVEPSLQAAFIDYGGNRHGFLAFSEIHPDYYQIPVADRQALLAAEAEEARAARESEEASDDLEASNGEEALEDETADAVKDKKKPRRRRSKKARAEDEEAKTEAGEEKASDSEVSATDEAAKDPADDETPLEDATSQTPDGQAVDEKPKRRTSRRKAPRKKAVKAADESVETDVSAQAQAPSVEESTAVSTEDEPEDNGPSTTMAAENETDEISEPVPDAEARDAEKAIAEEAKPAPKKRRASTRRKKAKEAEASVDETLNAEPENAETAEATVEAVSSDENANASEGNAPSDGPAEDDAKPKSKSRPRRRSRSRKAKPDETESTEDDNGAGDENHDGAAGVESVGQEDALEEVPAPRRARRHYKIQEVIKRRQVLLVQVVKEERGTKGAALTTYLSLAGRYSVLMPNTARGGGISRKITNSADRKRLKAIASELEVPEGMGVILRTAGASRIKDEITRDFEYLMRLWGQVRNLTLSSTAPCLVYEEGSLIKRSIRDLYDRDTGEVIVAGETGFQEAKDFMNMLMPSHANKVKTHRDSQSIFVKYGVESQLEKMVSPQVTLKSGGYLIINQTEALVAVDVNSGRATREHSIEDTALQTNLEAAEEVARQLRLRDLAGLIVIDFIDMEERRNNRTVEKKLKECLKNDRARIQVGRISHFGLLEMSRQRMRASVLESTMDICPHCAGTGYVRSDSAIALHVFRAIEEHVSRHNRFDCLVRTTPAIATHILNHKRAALLALEDKYGLQVIVEGDHDITGQEFVVEKGEAAQGDPGPAVIGYQNEDGDGDAEPVSDEEDGSRKRRGRRRKRKSHDDDRESEADNSEKSDTKADKPNDVDGETDDGKRKRGRRNTRKSRRDDPVETDDSPAARDGVGEEPSRKPSKAPPSDADAEGEQSKRRSTVRRKAPIAAKPEAMENNGADDGLSETSSPDPSAPDASVSEPPRTQRRRTTRRKKESESETESGNDAAPASDGSEPAQISASSEDEDKKAGWWRRGLF